MVPHIFNGILLGFLSLADVRSRKIPVAPCLLYGAAGLIWRCFYSENRSLFLLSLVSISTFIFLLSLLLRKACGAGDFLAAWACSCMAGARNTAGVVLVAVVLAGFYAAGLIIRRKAGGKDTFPFVPFLFMGQILLLAADVAAQMAE